MNGVGIYTDDFINIKEDLDLIKENVRRVLLTEPGERVNNPLFGSPLKRYIFEAEPIVRSDIELEIIDSLNRWVPNITVESFSIDDNYEENKMKVSMTLKPNDTEIPFSYETLINY